MTKPAGNEVEFSLFGPGFGECAVLHLYDNQWVIIDSCRNPETKRPVALEYLGGIGVDVATDVLMVVATHWHDDHIDGLAEVFSEAKEATFACTAAITAEPFQSVLRHFSGTPSLPGGSGIAELDAILVELEARTLGGGGRDPRLAKVGCILHESNSPVNCRIDVLAPSDRAVLAATVRMEKTLEGMDPAIRRRVPRMDPNDTSIVLSVAVGEAHLLLGGDLEHRGREGVGWHAVLGDWNCEKARHRCFKVPHHGSSNGHFESVWSEMLEEETVALVSPFHNGSVLLPSATDCQRILSLTDKSYLTAPPRAGRYSFQGNSIRRTMLEATLSLSVFPSKLGQIRVRTRSDVKAGWDSELFGAAISIRDFLSN